MAFRSGVNSARKGVVYSRRRGKGRLSMMRTSALRADAIETIFEEDEEESDFPDAGSNPLPIRFTNPSTSTGSALKDKSNVTRSPKKLTERRMERQNDLGEGRGPNALPQPTNLTIDDTPQTTAVGKATSGGIRSTKTMGSGSGIIDEIGLGNTGSKNTIKVYTDPQSSFEEDAGIQSKDDHASKPAKKKQTASRRKTTQISKSQPSVLTSQTSQTNAPFNISEDQTSTIEQSTPSKHRKPSKKPKNARRSVPESTAQMEEEVTMTSSAGSNEVKEKSKTPKRRKPRKQKAGQGVKGRRKTVAAGMGHESGISDDNGTSRGFETEMEELYLDERCENVDSETTMAATIKGDVRPASPASSFSRPSTMTPTKPPANNPEESFQTPTPQTHCTPAPPHKPFQFWTSSNPIEPFIASPSPPTEMNTEDFVILRHLKEDAKSLERPGTPIIKSRDILRGARNKSEDYDDMEHSASDRINECKGLESRAGEKRGKKMEAGKGNRWVRFLDVALTVPSDESDDELDFCKPSPKHQEQQTI